MLEHRVILPNVNLNKPNPAIRWKQYHLRVPRDREPLPARSDTGRPLIAMTSSGIGGANGHAVIEGPPAASGPPAFWQVEFLQQVPALLVAGALSPRSATAVGETLLDHLLKHEHEEGAHHALARHLGRRTRSMTWRSGVLYSSALGASSGLNFDKPALATKVRSPIVFVFSGQGTQHLHSKL